MPWQYSQSTGELKLNNQLVTDDGYSGFGQGRDNPQMENIRNVGLIPHGVPTPLVVRINTQAKGLWS
jgi:hypothetical protein